MRKVAALWLLAGVVGLASNDAEARVDVGTPIEVVRMAEVATMLSSYSATVPEIGPAASTGERGHQIP